MRNGKGVSLLETLVVIAIIATMSLIGINTIISFRTDSELDNTANELVADIRLARNKSMSGELLPGETADNFDPTDGLPVYGLKVEGNSYKIVRKCLKPDGSTCVNEPPVSSVAVSANSVLTPVDSFYFDRIDGKTEARTITISSIKGHNKRVISIAADFTITVTK